MKPFIRAGALAATVLAVRTGMAQQSTSDSLGVPKFHHVHVNSTNPDAAVDFYTREFPSTSRTTFAGSPAVAAPNNVLLVFTKVNTPAPLLPQTAIWHYGWQVVDVRKNLAMYKERPEVKLLPLYASPDGDIGYVSSDALPGTGGVLGLTRAGIAEAKAAGVQPKGGAGFAYMQAPDGAIIEYIGNSPAERFNHVHMYWEDPFCAQLWYQTHLRGTIRGNGAAHTEADCKVPRGPDTTWPALEKEGMYRTPSASVTFSDVSLSAYMRPGDQPLVSTRGHLADHFALSVAASRCVDREIARRGRHVPRRALQGRRYARRDDRRSEPRSDRADRGQIVRATATRSARFVTGRTPRHETPDELGGMPLMAFCGSVARAGSVLAVLYCVACGGKDAALAPGAPAGTGSTGTDSTGTGGDSSVSVDSTGSRPFPADNPWNTDISAQPVDARLRPRSSRAAA